MMLQELRLSVNPYVAPCHDGDDNRPSEFSGRNALLCGLEVASWIYPLVLVGFFYGTWLSAWVVLGRQPRPSRDDPKAIGSLVDIPYLLTGVLLIGFPVAAFSGLVVNACVLSIRRVRGYVILLVLAAFTLLWVGTFAFLNWDPLSVVEWYMD